MLAPCFKTCGSHTFWQGTSLWGSWLRNCVTSRKVAGSVPESFRPHYGPGGDQPLTEMSTRNISWGVKVTGA